MILQIKNWWFYK